MSQRVKPDQRGDNMDWSTILSYVAPIILALGGVGGIVAGFMHKTNKEKARADTRKTDAETDGARIANLKEVIDALTCEVTRLRERTESMEGRIKSLENELATVLNRERENKKYISALEDNIELLESENTMKDNRLEYVINGVRVLIGQVIQLAMRLNVDEEPEFELPYWANDEKDEE